MQSFDIKDLMSRLQGLDQRKADDEIYAQIYDEYSAGLMDKVAQARAIEAASCDHEKIKSEYIRFRFIRIKDELAALERTARNKQAEINANRKADEREKRRQHFEKKLKIDRLKRMLSSIQPSKRSLIGPTSDTIKRLDQTMISSWKNTTGRKIVKATGQSG